jgi:hypothetical protein
MGEAVWDRPSQEDPTVELGHAITLARMPPSRTAPALWQTLTIPDPFEHHQALLLELPPERLLLQREELPLPALPNK